MITRVSLIDHSPHDTQITVVNKKHDDVIKWKRFPRYWPFVRGIHRSPVNSPHKGRWRWALMFCSNYAWNKLLSKQSLCWWFKTPSGSLWRQCNLWCKHDQSTKVHTCYSVLALIWQLRLYQIWWHHMASCPWPLLFQAMACRLLWAKPLPKPMATYCQWNPEKQPLVTFQSKYPVSLTKIHLKMACAKC